ncbi:MAG: hypothetical protein HEQ35_03245 [Gloeotrichia echinulata IR180]
MISVTTNEGQTINVAAIQLDHITSWQAISQSMDNYNNQLQPRPVDDRNLTPLEQNQVYTLWDAKMYYNDQDNLQAGVAANNAAAGEQGMVQEIRNPVLDATLSTIGTQWLLLQQAVQAVVPHIQDPVDSENVLSELLRISEEMEEIRSGLGV